MAFWGQAQHRCIASLTDRNNAPDGSGKSQRMDPPGSYDPLGYRFPRCAHLQLLAGEGPEQ